MLESIFVQVNLLTIIKITKITILINLLLKENRGDYAW